MLLNDQQQAVIHTIIHETNTTKTFVLLPKEKLIYQSGQFLTLLFPEQTKDNSILRRSYSFSSAPGIDPLPAITIKRTDNGFASRKLIDKMEVGDNISYSHVAGQFMLPTTTEHLENIIFFAAGSGITPIFSLLKTILSFHPHLHVTLVYSSKNPKETIFYKELTQLEKSNNSRLKIVWLFSQSEDKDNARLSHFLLLSLLNDLKKENGNKMLFYLCGPFDYMDMITIILKTEGMAAKQIKREHFYIPRRHTPTRPPDKSAQEIELQLNGTIYSFIAAYPDSILTSALKNDIPLHFSCQSGQCGSCVAKCIHGNVWMRYNEVLTENDLKQGLILTCSGFPVGGSVKLIK